MHVEIRKGACRLPQAGVLANDLLAQRLNATVHSQEITPPGLWRHKRTPITFTLVVDDFGVEHAGAEDVLDLADVL